MTNIQAVLARMQEIADCYQQHLRALKPLMHAGESKLDYERVQAVNVIVDALRVMLRSMRVAYERLEHEWVEEQLDEFEMRWSTIDLRALFEDFTLQERT